MTYDDALHIIDKLDKAQLAMLLAVLTNKLDVHCPEEYQLVKDNWLKIFKVEV